VELISLTGNPLYLTAQSAILFAQIAAEIDQLVDAVLQLLNLSSPNFVGRGE
jgi:hypothetical protein